MAAEDQVKPIDHFNHPGFQSCPIRHGIEGASQSWTAGAVLLASSGKIVEAADDPSAGTILGFAVADASGVTDNPVTYIPALPGLTFEVNLEDASAGDHELVQTNMLTKYGLEKSALANGAWYLDENDTSGTHALVIEIGIVDNPIGTVQPRVRAQILDAATLYA